MRLCCSRDVGIHMERLMSKLCAAFYVYASFIRQTENKVDNKSNAEIFPTHPSADEPSRIYTDINRMGRDSCIYLYHSRCFW